MEGYTLRQQPLAALRGPSPLLRFASDERLIELTRAGQQSAFEALVARYQPRLLAFCRHMLRSREDAEDVLQEVFAAAFNAIMADSREINAKPWLYRIARNRSLNHLRRNTAIGVDSMDAVFADAGQSTSEKVHKREEFRLLVGDIGHLPESQRAALILREMEALSYEQIADVMDTTVPSVKSLLVRARMGLAEAAEARKLTCEEVRYELGEAAEGIGKLSAPVRRHVKRCQHCRGFRSQLRDNNRALAAIMPIAPLIFFKKALLAKLGLAKFGAGGAGATATAGSSSGAGGVFAGSAAVAGGSAGGVAATAVAVKAVAVVATVAVVAVGGNDLLRHRNAPTSHGAAAAATTAEPQVSSANPPEPRNLIQRLPQSTALSAAALTREMRHQHAEALRYGVPQAPALRAGTTSATGTTGTTTTELAASTPAATTTPVLPPADTTPAVTEVATTTAIAPTPTPTTQEISTTTVFPSTGTSTTTPTSTATTPSTPAAGAPSASSPTSTGSSGTPATTTTGSTGATGTPGTGGSTGATGATGSTGATTGNAANGATGSTGSP